MSTGRRLKAGRTLAVFSGVLGYGVQGLRYRAESFEGIRALKAISLKPETQMVISARAMGEVPIKGVGSKSTVGFIGLRI